MLRDQDGLFRFVKLRQDFGCAWRFSVVTNSVFTEVILLHHSVCLWQECPASSLSASHQSPNTVWNRNENMALLC